MPDAAAAKTLGTFLVSDELIKDSAAYATLVDRNARDILAYPSEKVAEVLMLAALAEQP